jgi:hypothetical protein
MNNIERYIFCFRTEGQWTGDDVIRLVSSATQIYDVFYSYYVIRNLQKEQEKNYMRNLEKYEHYFHRYLDHPMYEELYHVWLKILEDWRKFGHKAPFMPPPLPFPFPFSQIETRFPEPSMIFEEITLYQSSHDKLVVDRIHIASPGGFSFAGIGEIVQQLRELIKDIWFRNNQEKTKGELEIIEKYLRLEKEYSNSNIPPVSSVTIDRKMLGKIKDSIGQLRTLEEKKKLLNVGEHLDNRPE